MPLNYSKWDQLELSDDSDIEGHPNVDKKSLIRWKQRDIHEKREARNFRIESLGVEIACNDVLLARLRAFLSSLSSPSPSVPVPVPKRFSNEVERLRANPSPEAPPSNAAQPVSYDEMVLRLLEAVGREAAGDAPGPENEKLGERLVERLKGHIEKLSGVIEASKKEKAELEAEKKKHITMEDMKEGWESKYVPAKPEPEPIVKPKATKKETVTTMEVLNPSASSSSSTPAPTPTPASDDGDELPKMTADLEAFARIPLWSFERSWEFIQGHRAVVVPGASDALLVAAFEAETKGEKKLAKQCVHQSLLLQYGDKLGKDGLKLFFQRMIQGGQKAYAVFAQDVEGTYAHIAQRVQATQAETSSGQEQIQLVAEDPGVEIHFNVPDGPPPEHLVLEGPGTEGLDVEEVRKALQLRWDVFEGLPSDMQEALKTGELDAVNKVLGAMVVSEAERVVEMLDVGGILSFAEGGIRDATEQGGDEDEDAEDAEEGELEQEGKAEA
ncbi:Cdc37 N terminal kinase binding-domain-containing protein [Vararia minispora EC-137]|uniref:Cdc37 N terminal kinase binding-domain-containing protein n=1 Tax=Vararia minispora EC-137 TaxID=1314806 RepID=A0ACB8QH67_9AGAM|nr:Cdc37 N terminal kinase binding-domain-containing protein [Vararia minispora EC-137]